MEYIQTVLVQIEASRLEQASAPGGLLAEVDEHRNFLKQQSGFRDLRVTRSINPEGNVLIVVETRWSDDSSLVRYETGSPNAASIVGKHSDVIVADSLQVLDMEALRTESSWAPQDAAASARTRVMMPLLIPTGVLAFMLLVIYGLSRIYLEVSGNGAVALATGIAIGVLLIAMYFAANPKAPGWQIGGVVVVLAGLLIGGTIWAVTEEDPAHVTGEEPTGQEPTPGPGAGGPDDIAMGNNFFDHEGTKNPTITVAAGKESKFSITNDGKAIHNMHVAGEGSYDTTQCAPSDDDPCSDPNIIPSGGEAEITILIAEAGSYDFRCDFHPAEMTGKIQVE